MFEDAKAFFPLSKNSWAVLAKIGESVKKIPNGISEYINKSFKRDEFGFIKDEDLFIKKNLQNVIKPPLFLICIKISINKKFSYKYCY
jgi:hypothetical protein